MANPISGIDEAGDAVRKVIRAYHGSPYDWDRVDMSMVGKGEGPLLEGFGFYATDAEKNANWYRYNNTVVRRRGIANVIRASRDLARMGLEPDATKMFDAVGSVIPRLQKSFPRGRTYELELPFAENQLLKWDAPLREQPDNVLRAVDKLVGSDFRRAMEGSDWDTGSELYWTLAGRKRANMPSDAQMQEASKRLFDEGVPGHVYLDEGAKNFVAYPGAEDSIRILRKYGLMAPVAAGAMQEER
jgi:hypothetical protein